MDRYCVRAINEWKNAGLPEDAAALLLAQSDLPEPAAEGKPPRSSPSSRRPAPGTRSCRPTPAEGEALFAARRLVYPALERRGDDLLVEDICLPRARLHEMIALVDAIGARHDVLIATAAHAGDGNLHPVLITPRGDEAAGLRARAAFEEIVDAAIEFGGTVTGEHGVGLLKRAGLRRELGPDVLALHRAVKEAFDPDGILNPGKKIG